LESVRSLFFLSTVSDGSKPFPPNLPPLICLLLWWLFSWTADAFFPGLAPFPRATFYTTRLSLLASFPSSPTTARSNIPRFSVSFSLFLPNGGAGLSFPIPPLLSDVLTPEDGDLPRGLKIWIVFLVPSPPPSYCRQIPPALDAAPPPNAQGRQGPFLRGRLSGALPFSLFFTLFAAHFWKHNRRACHWTVWDNLPPPPFFAYFFAIFFFLSFRCKNIPPFPPP